MIINYSELLNPQQLEAVKHCEGPILILAGAGSGKTRALTYRIVHLINEHQAEPEQILAVTFTNKATNEMRERLIQMLGREAKDLWVSTFHSLALRILRQHALDLNYPSNFTVFDDDDSKSIIKKIINDLGLDPKKFPPKFFQQKIDWAKNWYIEPEQYLNNYKSIDGEDQILGQVYQRYQTELFKNQGMDFGDLLVNVNKLFEQKSELLKYYQGQLKFILVDEFQDTNLVQYLLIKRLSAKHQNLFVVGDDDQSIYGFRGADINNILNFEKDFENCKTIKLEQNYRSSQNILQAANAIIAKNKTRKIKQLWTDQEQGEAVYCFCGNNEESEANFIAKKIKDLISAGVDPKDIAVFYRINAQSRAIEEALLKQNIYYRIFGGLRFYDRKEIKDIIAYVRAAINPNDTQALLRIINTPNRGIGTGTVAELHRLSNEQPLWQALNILAESKKQVRAFVSLILQLQAYAKQTIISELVEKCILESGYKKYLETSKDLSSGTRLENLAELKAIAYEFDAKENNIQAFLDHVSLTSAADLTNVDNSDKYVSLMTLHISKGLEFSVVFLCGLEEGLLPHYRALQDVKEMEEERRLCYVGLTRAKEKLYLTRAIMRGMFSSQGSLTGYRKPSRFVADIPSNLIENLGGDFFNDYSYEDQTMDLDQNEIEFASNKKSFKNNSWFDRHLKKEAVVDCKFELDDQKEGEILSTTELVPGLKVKHKYLGLGTIESLQVDHKDFSRSKIKVNFESLKGSSELLLSKTELTKVY